MQEKQSKFNAGNLSFLYVTAITIYLISVPFQMELLDKAALVLWIISFLFSVMRASLSYKIVGIFFLVFSIFLTILSEDFYRLYGTGEVFNGAYIILPVIVLFYIVPLLAIPIQIGPYSNAISKIMYMVKKGEVTSRISYLSMSYSVYLLSSITSFGAIATTKYSLQQVLAGFDKEMRKTIGIKTLSRGVPLVAMWTPISITGIIAVTNVGGDWLVFMKVAILFSLFLLFVQTLLSFVEVPFMKAQVEIAAHLEENKNVRMSFFHLIVMLLIFLLYIASSLFLTELFGFPLTYFITILVFPTIMIWSLSLNQGSAGFKMLKSYTVKLHKQSDTICAFLPVGLFVYTIQNTEYIEFFYQFFIWTQTQLNLLGTIFLIGIIPILLAQVGVFPIVSIILLSQLIDPSVVQMRPEWLALLIAATSSAGFISTPFAMVTQLVGNLYNVSSREVVRKNLFFIAIMYVSTGVLVYLLQLLAP